MKPNAAKGVLVQPELRVNKMAMDFDTYMAGVETKTGKNWREFLPILKHAGLSKKGTTATMVKNYLAENYGIGHGHAMGIWRVFKPMVEE